MSKIWCPFCSFSRELLPGLLAFEWQTLSPDPGGCIIVYSSLCASDRAFSVSRSLLKSPALPSTAFHVSSSHVPPLVWSWAEAVRFGFAYACPIFLWLLQLNLSANLCVLVDASKNVALHFSLNHFSNSRWDKHTAQTTAAWMVTLKCLKIAAEAALDGLRALLSNIHKQSLLRRQRNHPPLLIFPADLAVWVFLVFLYIYFFFIMIATFLLLTSRSVGKEGHNSIWPAFHQISWDGKSFSCLARETILAFQILLLPALCMFYSCCSENHW